MRAMRYRIALVLAVLTLITTTPAAAEIDISAYVRNWTGVFANSSVDFSILQNTFEPTFEYSGEKAAINVTPFVYHYATQNQRIDFGLRSAYIDLYFKHADIRIGQQQVIWGKADGVFITDIISPKDLSQFLLREFYEIRQGITAAKVDFYIADHTLELIWAPMFTPTKLPEIGSVWRPQMPLALPVQPTLDNSNEKVPFNIASSEIFGKFAAMTSLVDLEVMGGYMWDDDPSLHVKKTINPATRMVSTVTVMPEHHRLILAGGSFSTTVWGFVIRGEGAYYFNKNYNTINPRAVDGLVEKDYVHYLVGVDKTLWGVRLSSQFIQHIIINHDSSIVADKIENTMTILANTDFLQETLTVNLFAYIGFNNGDALIRPSVGYDILDGLNATLGADLFVGTAGTFGQYNNNDMIYTKLKYSF